MPKIDRKLMKRNLKKHERTGSRFWRAREGKNVLRILTFEHKLNEFDHLADRCEKDEIGKTIEHFFVDVHRVWKGKNWINCLADKDKCALWQEYWSMPKNERKNYRPNATFVLNVVDMDEQHKGVQQIQVTSAYVLGERSTTGKKLGYGIADLYYGWDPKEERKPEIAEDSPGAKDSVSGEEVESMGKGRLELDPIDGFGDELLGLKGRDVIVVCKKTKGERGEQIRLDHDSEHGAITVRKAEYCTELPKAFLNGVKDLWMVPDFYPGEAREVSMRQWPVAQQFAEFIDKELGRTSYKGAAQTRKTEGDGEVEAPRKKSEEPKEEAEKPAAVKKPRGRRKKAEEEKPHSFDKGDKVLAVDMWNEDNTKKLPQDDWTTYVARFDGYEKDEETGGTKVVVLLKPEDQDDDDVKERLEEYFSGLDPKVVEGGGPFMKFDHEAIKPYAK